MFTRLAAGLLAGASLAALAAPAKAATCPLEYRWCCWSTSFSAFKTFLESGEITDRALLAGINNPADRR